MVTCRYPIVYLLVIHLVHTLIFTSDLLKCCQRVSSPGQVHEDSPTKITSKIRPYRPCNITVLKLNYFKIFLVYLLYSGGECIEKTEKWRPQPLVRYKFYQLAQLQVSRRLDKMAMYLRSKKFVL